MAFMDKPEEREGPASLGFWMLVLTVLLLLGAMIIGCNPAGPTVILVPDGGGGSQTQVVGDGNFGTGNSNGNKLHTPTPAPSAVAATTGRAAKPAAPPNSSPLPSPTSERPPFPNGTY